jgi:hypothetical protein
MRRPSPVRDPVEIGSWAELARLEPEILARIADAQNGGNLYMTHPFRTLADLGFVLTPSLLDQIRRRYPEMQGLSDVAYEATKAAGPQNVRFHVLGLFRTKRS